MKKDSKIALAIVGGGVTVVGAFFVGMWYKGKLIEAQPQTQPQPQVQVQVQPQTELVSEAIPERAVAQEEYERVERQPTTEEMYWDLHDVELHPDDPRYRQYFIEKYNMTPEEAKELYQFA